MNYQWEFSYDADNGWITSGFSHSPTTGFVDNNTRGPLGWLADNLPTGLVDILWMFAIGGLGFALTLGFCSSIAGWGGLILNLFIWFSTFPPANNPIFDAEHFTLGFSILLLMWLHATFAATDLRFTVVAANTAIAAAFGATIAMFYAMVRMGKPDPGMMANGMLAGLVAITAPCAFVQPWAAAVIGALAAVIVIESIFIWERRHIDDPVGAISVHGVCGIFGVLCVGIFADGRYGGGWNATDTSATRGNGITGILYGSGKFLGNGAFGELGFGQLASQLIGALTSIFVMGAVAFVFFKAQHAIMKHGIRSRAEDEEAGLDLPEMGVLAYDNLQLRELDVVGIDEELVFSGGPSQEPTTRR